MKFLSIPAFIFLSFYITNQLSKAYASDSDDQNLLLRLKVGAQVNTNPTFMKASPGSKPTESFLHVDPLLMMSTRLGGLTLASRSEARFFRGTLFIPRPIPEVEEKVRLDYQFSGITYRADGLYQQKNETDWDLFLPDLRAQVLGVDQSFVNLSNAQNYYWLVKAKLRSKDYLYDKLTTYNHLQGLVEADSLLKVTDQQYFQIRVSWNSRVYPSTTTSHLVSLAYPSLSMGLKSQLTRGNELKINAGYAFLPSLGTNNNNGNPISFSLELNSDEGGSQQNFWGRLKYAPEFHHLDLMSQVLEAVIGTSNIYYDRFQMGLLARIRQVQLPNRLKGADTLMGAQFDLKYFLNMKIQFGLLLAVQSVYSSLDRTASTFKAQNFLDSYPYVFPSQGISFTGNVYAQLTL